jgi:hypothetical protein
MRNLASGAIAGAEALQRVVPGEAAQQVEQVVRTLVEITERLEP